jgi:GT2 family glycosyltransferase
MANVTTLNNRGTLAEVARGPEFSASIVVVSYNSREHLGRCLDSLWATLCYGCEVILVDNASTDGSADYVAEQFPWVHLVRLPRNEGFAEANNRGVALARRQHIVALNPDTEVTDGWLPALLAPFANEDRSVAPVGMTTARILVMQEPGRVNTCGNTMHITGITSCRGLGKRSDDASLAAACEVSAVSGACFAMSRQLWIELGGLDRDFFMYVEDADLSLRTRLAGYRCVYTPSAVVYHNYNAKFAARKFYYLERNRGMMLLKCLSARTLVLMLPVLALAECIAWGYALKAGPSHVKSKLQAYTWLGSNWRLVMRKRRWVAHARRVDDHELLRGVEWRLNMRQLAGPLLGPVAGAVLNPLFRLWYLAVSAVPGTRP